ncbi:MAG: succinate dehydrogenase, partial [Myxococcota bacterium]|nr:succinate dehydrogenase [Myxococcota bacterium]
NLHRYTWYIAVAYIIILYYDAYLSFWRGGELGVGVGSIILLLNPTLLAMYTFGCHSCRHMAAGRLDCFSCDKVSQTRHGIWKRITWLNERHMLWAWISMIWVGLTDYYVRMVALGHITDFNTWGL